MKLSRVNCNIEREPLAAPFGFKGGYISELWQSAVRMECANGDSAVGLGTQSILWSDAAVFANNPEAAGNGMMFLASCFAAKMAMEIEWDNPIELLDQVLEATYEYAKKVTRNESLRLTFALNSLVAVDNAAWLLYAKANNISDFDAMLPDEFMPALSERHEKIACVPLVTYGVSSAEILDLVNSGFFFLKIKIGSDPDKDGDQDKMLEWDMQRLSEIHDAVKDIETPYTDSGHVAYYLDANGRYDSKERLVRFLDHAEKIGAIDRILLLEEPFAEENHVDVSDINVRLVADESAHCDKDVVERIEMGYGAIALKPIAKTVSMSLKILKIAAEKKVPCFCADLTVNPVLVDWNKNFASRMPMLDGLKTGVLESNGHQNYKNWDTMRSYHPCCESAWSVAKDGIFNLDEDFYNRSGGIFLPSSHYQSLVP